MKATWMAAILGLTLLVAGCSQQTADNVYLEEDAPASATTKSKIGVETWMIRGGSAGVEVKGQSAAGRIVHDLKITLNPDSTCDAIKNYRDSSGNVVASLQFKVGKDGKLLGRTPIGNPSDPNLCPQCLGDDLKTTEPPAASAVEALVTRPPGSLRTPCERAQRRLARAFSNLESACDPNINSTELCTMAGWEVAMAMQEVNQNCLVVASLRTTLLSDAGRPSFLLATRKPRAG